MSKKNATEIRLDQHDAALDKIGESMQAMVIATQGLRQDMTDRAEKYLEAMNTHALEDSTRFGKLETKMALYVGMGMCFAAFAPDIIKGVSAAVGHP